MLLKRSDPLSRDLMPIPPHRLIPYIERFLREGRHVGDFTVDDRARPPLTANAVRHMHFHPSGDCMKCERRLYFDRVPELRIEERFEPKTLMIFMEGTLIHSYLQAMFSEWNGIQGYPEHIGNEVRVKDEGLCVGGYIDAIVKFPEDDAPTLVEIKTIGSYGYSLLSGNPKPEHRLQLGTYLALTGYPRGIILYVNKDTSDMTEFEVEPMDMEPTFARWMRVTDALREKSPEHLAYSCREGDVTWQRCPYKDRCRRIF